MTWPPRRDRGLGRLPACLAAAIASESEQQGWQEPELIGREHRQRFMTLGHPIVAGDVAHAIPEAIADVIA